MHTRWIHSSLATANSFCPFFQRSEYFIKGKIVKNSIHSKHQNNMRMYKSEQHWGMSVIHLLVVKIFTVQLFFTVISNRWAWFENYVNVDIDSFLCFWIRSTWNAAKHLINEKETFFFYDCAWVRLLKRPFWGFR